ncbi:hypothetical protein BN1708_016985, partial [Verticillium longisporum]
GELGRPTPSQLQRFIQGACSPENYEPNLALNLEIADLINSKKGSAPREAVVSIVSYINHRNPSVALLALHLLDICVKNCGYPFHLQISTKEFLNELVRRFPERPPLRATRVQMKILEAIEEWRSTICETSRYKEDLGFIRDMHRLLSYKGYTFPEVRRDDAAVLNPSDRAALDEHRRRLAVLLDARLEHPALAQAVGLGTDVENLRQRRNVLLEVVHALARLAADAHDLHVAAKVLNLDAVPREVRLDLVDARVLLVDLVDGHNHGHLGGAGVLDGFE